MGGERGGGGAGEAGRGVTQQVKAARARWTTLSQHWRHQYHFTPLDSQPEEPALHHTAPLHFCSFTADILNILFSRILGSHFMAQKNREHYTQEQEDVTSSSPSFVGSP